MGTNNPGAIDFQLGDLCSAPGFATGEGCPSLFIIYRAARHQQCGQRLVSRHNDPRGPAGEDHLPGETDREQTPGDGLEVPH